MLDKVLSILMGELGAIAKKQAQSRETYIRTLKQLGLDPDHPPADFGTAYTYALVEYALQQEGAAPAVLQLLGEPEIRAAFRQAFEQWDAAPLSQAVDQRIALTQDAWANEWNFVAQAIAAQGIDVQREVTLFFTVFVSVVQRSQTPKEKLQQVMLKQELSQQMGELRSQLAGISNLAALPQALTQTLNEIRLLAAGDRDAASSESPLATRLRDWFEVLGYGWESHSIVGEDYFEWIITIPVRRRRYDRVLVRGVMGEAGMSDLQELRDSVQQHGTDEGWLISNRRVSSAARKAVEQYDPLSCYTLDELLDEDADFTQYLEWLEQEIRDRRIDQDYIPLGCSKDEIDPKTHQKLGISHYGEDEGWIEGYVDQWLADPSKEHLSVLGEFGTGKTWFALHYAWVALQKYQEAKRKGVERPRLPLVIPLRDYAKAVSVESLFSEFFFRKHEIPLPGYSAFERLNRMGKLLLIFDGFDEMAARVNRQAMIDNFWELARVVVPGAKAILTCRTEHFPDAIEGRKLLGAELKASTANLTGEPPQFEVLELAKFSDEQIGQLLGRKAKPETVAKVTDNPQLLDLARRPVMVDLILEALPEIEAGKPVDMARVYLYAVTQKMDRDIKSDRTFTSLADKLYFLCELSWEMLSTDQMSLNYRAFPARLQQMFDERVREEKELDHWRYDMMGQTMLIRNSEGDYSPAHRSLLEFFVAYKIVASLGAMAEDFVAVAREQSGVDGSLAAQEYTWEGYFRRSLRADGMMEAIAPLDKFRAMGYEALLPLLRDAKLARAVLDLASPMLDGETMRERLLPLVWETRGRSLDEVGYFGGNVVQLMLGRSAYALEGCDLSGTIVQGVDFTRTYLRKSNFQNANLEGAVLSKAIGGISLVALNPKGDCLAVCGGGGVVQIWSVVSGQVILVCSGHSAWVNFVTFSPDGKLLASGSHDQTIKLWSVESGDCVKTLIGHSGPVLSGGFSPDGKTIASSSDDRTIKLWLVESGDCINTLQGHSSWVGSVVFSPDGGSIATGSGDKTIKLWAVNCGSCIRTLQGHTGRVRSISFHPNGRFLASASTDHSVKLWSIDNGKCTCTIQEHSGRVRTVAFSPNGKILASGSDDESIKLWSMSDGKCISTLTGHHNWIRAIAFSPDSRTLVSASDGNRGIRFWSVDKGVCIQSFKSHLNAIRSVEFSPDGHFLASASSGDTSAKIWSINDGSCIQIFKGHLDWVEAVTFSPDSKSIASSSGDKTIKIWSPKDGTCLHTLQGHLSRPRAIAFSPNGRFLVSGSTDNTIKIWSSLTGANIRTLREHSSWARAVAISPDSKIIASGSSDKLIKLWSLETGECINTIYAHAAEVLSVAFSSDGQTLSSGSADRTIKLWSINSSECIYTINAHSDWVRSVQFSPDDQILVSGSDDKTVKLWSTDSRKCMSVCKGHFAEVRSVAFSPNGRTVASASFDETIRLWDTQNGQCIRVIDERVCKDTNITGVVGLTVGQWTALKLMGAIDHNDPQ